jgi:hypothetical protein
VAGIGAGQIKAEELDNSLASGAGVVGGARYHWRGQVRRRASSAAGRRPRRAEGPVARVRVVRTTTL